MQLRILIALKLELFALVEDALDLKRNTIKIGIMDEECKWSGFLGIRFCKKKQ